MTGIVLISSVLVLSVLSACSVVQRLRVQFLGLVGSVMLRVLVGSVFRVRTCVIRLCVVSRCRCLMTVVCLYTVIGALGVQRSLSVFDMCGVL